MPEPSNPPHPEPQASASGSGAPAPEADEGRMPFSEHLRELRDRMRNAVIAIGCGFAVALAFKQELFIILVRPLLDTWEKQKNNPALSEHPQLVFGSLVEPFWTYFSVALWAGLFIASPFVFHQLWKFVAPGLYQKERAWGLLFAIGSSVFFIGGAIFCYILVLPAVTDFLLSYADSNLSTMTSSLAGEYQLAGEVRLTPMLSMQEYLGFARKLLLGFGLVFELPLLILFLSLVGLVTHRSLWRFNRWWIILSFAISAMLTPPDVVSQILMAGPLVVLYNLSIAISFFVTRSREKREQSLRL